MRDPFAQNVEDLGKTLTDLGPGELGSQPMLIKVGALSDYALARGSSGGE